MLANRSIIAATEYLRVTSFEFSLNALTMRELRNRLHIKIIFTFLQNKLHVFSENSGGLYLNIPFL